MARRHLDIERSPEQIGNDAARGDIAYGNALTRENNRRLQTAGRLRQRAALLASGADERFLPTVSEITAAAPLDDATYGDKVNRALRMGNARGRGADISGGGGSPLARSRPAPTSPGEATVLNAGGGEANVRLSSGASVGANLNPPGEAPQPTGRSGVAPRNFRSGYDKALFHQEATNAAGVLERQGFSKEEISDAINGAGTPEGYYNPARFAGAGPGANIVARANLRRAWMRDQEFNRKANPAIVGDQDAMRIAAQYGGKGTIPEKGATGYYDAKGTFLGPLYGDDGSKLPMPKGATGIRGTAGTSAPDTVQGQRERGGTPWAMSREDAYQLGYTGKPTNLLNKPAANRTPYEAAYLQGYDPREAGVTAPQDDVGLGSRVVQAVKSGANYVAGLFGGGGGGDVAAGASRDQAARIQTPTSANPVPVTETSPASDINRTDQSTAPAPSPTPVAQAEQPLPDQWENKRYAFEGF